MSSMSWPEPVAAASDEAAVAIVRGLWSRAARVDAAIADSGRLLELLGDVGANGPSAVNVVTRALPFAARPPDWRWTLVSDAPSPEFLLFYGDGSAFPESAIIFTGDSSDGWLTFHRRPIVLQRLRQRFELISVLIFTGEYLLRVWACASDPKYGSPVRGRLRFGVTPLALIDLVAVLPFYLPFLGRSRLCRTCTLRWQWGKSGDHVPTPGTFGKELACCLKHWSIG